MTTILSTRRIATILAAAGLVLGLAGAAAAQTTRDHRGDQSRKYEPRPTGGQPVIRDHRKPLFCFGGPFGGTNCYSTPYNPSR